MIDYREFPVDIISSTLPGDESLQTLEFSQSVDLSLPNTVALKLEQNLPAIEGTIRLKNDNQNKTVNVLYKLASPNASETTPVRVTILVVVTQSS